MNSALWVMLGFGVFGMVYAFLVYKGKIKD